MMSSVVMMELAFPPVKNATVVMNVAIDQMKLIVDVELVNSNVQQANV